MGRRLATGALLFILLTAFLPSIVSAVEDTALVVDELKMAKTPNNIEVKLFVTNNEDLEIEGRPLVYIFDDQGKLIDRKKLNDYLFLPRKKTTVLVLYAKNFLLDGQYTVQSTLSFGALVGRQTNTVARKITIANGVVASSEAVQPYVISFTSNNKTLLSIFGAIGIVGIAYYMRRRKERPFLPGYHQAIPRFAYQGSGKPSVSRPTHVAYAAHAPSFFSRLFSPRKQAFLYSAPIVHPAGQAPVAVPVAGSPKSEKTPLPAFVSPAARQESFYPMKAPDTIVRKTLPKKDTPDLHIVEPELGLVSFGGKSEEAHAENPEPSILRSLFGKEGIRSEKAKDERNRLEEELKAIEQARQKLAEGKKEEMSAKADHGAKSLVQDTHTLVTQKISALNSLIEKRKIPEDLAKPEMTPETEKRSFLARLFSRKQKEAKTSEVETTPAPAKPEVSAPVPIQQVPVPVPTIQIVKTQMPVKANLSVSRKTDVEERKLQLPTAPVRATVEIEADGLILEGSLHPQKQKTFSTFKGKLFHIPKEKKQAAPAKEKPVVVEAPAPVPPASPSPFVIPPELTYREIMFDSQQKTDMAHDHGLFSSAFDTIRSLFRRRSKPMPERSMQIDDETVPVNLINEETDSFSIKMTAGQPPEAKKTQPEQKKVEPSVLALPSPLAIVPPVPSAAAVPTEESFTITMGSQKHHHPKEEHNLENFGSFSITMGSPKHHHPKVETKPEDHGTEGYGSFSIKIGEEKHKEKKQPEVKPDGSITLHETEAPATVPLPGVSTEGKVILQGGEQQPSIVPIGPKREEKDYVELSAPKQFELNLFPKKVEETFLRRTLMKFNRRKEKKWMKEKRLIFSTEDAGLDKELDPTIARNFFLENTADEDSKELVFRTAEEKRFEEDEKSLAKSFFAANKPSAETRSKEPTLLTGKDLPAERMTKEEERRLFDDLLIHNKKADDEATFRIVPDQEDRTSPATIQQFMAMNKKAKAVSKKEAVKAPIVSQTVKQKQPQDPIQRAVYSPLMSIHKSKDPIFDEKKRRALLKIDSALKKLSK